MTFKEWVQLQGNAWFAFTAIEAAEAAWKAASSTPSAVAGTALDVEAISWALHRLRNFGVGHREEDALMLDRLHLVTMSVPSSAPVTEPAVAWLIVRHSGTGKQQREEREVVLSPLTDDHHMDEGDEAWPLYLRSATGFAYLVRCGGECPQDWLCKDIPDVQAALCEALYGRAEDADADEIGKYLAQVQGMVRDAGGKTELRYTFEDGWLQIIRISPPDSKGPDHG